MSDKKQTAVEWLSERLESITKDLFEQAKEMEKQQIIDAYDDGNYAYCMGIKEPEQYYNKKFKNQ